ncbi:TolC family outer membrane protein [Iodobacter sp. CM08]|uniref:TolC family outer membrane protein n=1 Tax=Iodobacter sp. CM08 TaxID=3085902 RepID=UPI0029819CE1|nr:TolC family outer membrane protein [Iodobacter sp. CM08]MDW5415616.1 TolC family outer membrane protein [Iodobacter sp. CM08]
MQTKICLLTLLICTTTHAADLSSLYPKALQNDSRFAIAKAQNLAAQEIVPIARAALLPNLSLSAQGSREWVNSEFDVPALGGKTRTISTDYTFNSQTYSATLSQPLFRMVAWDTLSQAQFQQKEANHALDRSQQELILRLAQQYLDVQLAYDKLQLLGEQKKAYREQKTQANKWYAAGYGTVTDVNEAQNRLDFVDADILSAEAAHSNKLHELSVTVGESMSQLAHRKPSTMQADLHLRYPLAEWLNQAKQNNPVLFERQASLDAAQLEISKNIDQHLPTVDLRLRSSYEDSPGYTTVDNVIKSNSLMIYASIPIFSGGEINARSKRAVAFATAASEDQRNTMQQVELGVRQQYMDLSSSAAQIKALQEAVRSGDVLVESTRKGIQSGVRNNVDLLNAQSRFFEAQQKHTAAQYTYLSGYIKLKFYAGTLQENDLQAVDQVLR